MIWRFSDLRHQRHLLGEFRPEADEEQAALKEIDAEEQELLDLAASAKWAARASTVNTNGDHQAAALLDRDGAKPEPMPKINELVRLVSSSPSVYSLLSVPTHGRRFGMMHGLEVTPSPHGKEKADAQRRGLRRSSEPGDRSGVPGGRYRDQVGCRLESARLGTPSSASR